MNDQDNRARGATKLNFEKPNTVTEPTDAEKPKAERAPVHRLVRLNLF